jgi:hypothetical protein
MTSLDDPVPATYTGLMHAGAGTIVIMGQLCALIPGLLPIIALTVVFAVPIVLALVALGVVGAALAGPPYLIWRVVRRR